ncbi:MAG: hypothetical protein HQL31_01335 [Planctomycetes bacterium]|nr:hypothetical protein [Planctomycetota bacterium]
MSKSMKISDADVEAVRSLHGEGGLDARYIRTEDGFFGRPLGQAVLRAAKHDKKIKKNRLQKAAQEEKRRNTATIYVGDRGHSMEYLNSGVFAVGNGDGMLYLAYLVTNSSPMRKYSPAQLLNFSEGLRISPVNGKRGGIRTANTVSGDDAEDVGLTAGYSLSRADRELVDSEYFKDCCDRIAELKEELDVMPNNDPRRNELEDEISQINRHSFTDSDTNKRINSKEKTQHTKIKGLIRKAYSRLKEKLKNKHEDLVAHLDTHLHLGDQMYYDGDIDWDVRRDVPHR